MNVKRAAEIRTLQVDLSAKLVYPEVLTGTPTVTEVTTTDLTISDIELTTDPTIPLGSSFIPGSFIPTDKGVRFRVSGGVAGRTYTLRVSVGTDATAPQTLIQDVTLMVN